MKIRDLRIGKYGWRVRVYFAVHGYHTRSILSSLEEIECPGTILERVRENLLRADMDSGFTYSNKTMRRSVVVVGLATSQAQFLNSFEHELRHLCDDIAAASGMPMQGEEGAYLTCYGPMFTISFVVNVIVSNYSRNNNKMEYKIIVFHFYLNVD